jgi:hypothetical protein
MASCTYGMPRSACSVTLEIYHGASTIILRILDWLLWIIDMLDLLAQPHNSRPYVQIARFLDLGSSWRWVVGFTPHPINPRKKGPWYILDKMLSAPQSRSGQHEEIQIVKPTETLTPTPRSSSP